MELNLVTEGLKFMVLGMVTVFLFLMVMIFILKLQAKIVSKYFPNESINHINTPPRKNQSNTNNKVLVAAITAAITTFKNSKT